MNGLLERQINEFLGDREDVPESFQTLFDAISDTYDRLGDPCHRDPHSSANRRG